MKLIKGLQTDTNEQDQPSDSYIWALNWVANQKQGSLVSERGFELKFQLPNGLQPLCMMPTADKVVIFSVNGVNSEIGIYDELTGTYTPKLNDVIVSTQLGGTVTGLNFNALHQIKAIYRYNFAGDLEIAFTDWFNPPRIITLPENIAEMIDYYLPYDINKLNIFQTALFNTVDTIIESSGSLIADAYFVFYRYKNIDQTTTNCYIHPEPQYIIIDDIFDDYITITGNDVGGTTNKNIKVNFGPLDPTFPLLEVGLYRVSTAEAKIITTIPTNQISATLSLFEGTTIQLAEVISPRVYYSKAKTLSSLNDVLYLGNLSKDTLDIPQKYINNIRLKWTCRMIDPAETKQNKDYNIPLKTFMANEVYSFLIRFKFKTGDYSTWKHISGRKAVPNKQILRRQLFSTNAYAGGTYTSSKTMVTDIINEKADIPAGGPYSNYQGKYFHTVDTCNVTASSLSGPSTVRQTPEDYMEGDFGYWENDNESYNEYYSGEDLQVWSALGNTGNILNDTTNTNVRHHKFPSLNFIEKHLTEVNFGTVGAVVSQQNAHFANSFPQLGVKVDFASIADILPPDLADLVVGYELGFSARDFNNCTVYGQDLSLFGVYMGFACIAPDVTSANGNIYLKNQAVKDAIYFTGSNSMSGGAGNRSTCAIFDASGNKLMDVPANQIQNYTHAPFDIADAALPAYNQIPNRQRIFTPDLVDPLFPVNNPAISPTHIRHEVMIVTGQKETQTSQTFNPGAGKNLYTIESHDGNFLGNNNYNLIDYCGELNRGTDVNKNTNANYTTLCLRNIPDNWVHRNIKASGYVPKTTRSVVIGDSPVINACFNYQDGGGDLYGGSDHYHIQLYDKMFVRPGSPEDYADDTSDVLALYSSFLTKQNYSGAGLFSDPNPNVPTFNNRHCIPSLNACRVHGTFLDVEKQHHSAFLCSIQRFATSIYNKFYNIGVINTLENPLEPGIFLGDCFVSEVQYVTHGSNMPVTDDPVNNPYVGQTFNAFRFYAHTRKNMDYRFQKTTTVSENNQYYPASKWNVNFVYSGAGALPTSEIFYSTSLPGTQAKNLAYQAFNYNNVYGTQPNFNIVSNIYANQTIFNDITEFPFRIHASEKQAKESQLNNWRVLLALNYYENDKTKGEITNLQGYDDQLLIHTVQSLFFTRDRGNLQSSDLGITIGTGGIFDFPPKEVIYDNLGYTGTQHQFGCAMTKLGYAFTDAQQGKYFVYNKDSGLIELSNLGMFNYFKDFGRTNHNDYYNNKASGLSAWNVCFDEFNGRLLIGYRNRAIEDFNSFTLSYTDGFKSFTSFHSYFPHLLCNTRKGVYSFNGDKFYKHNTPNRGYYVGASTRNELDVIFNTTPINTKSGITQGGKEFTKLWQSFNWNSEMHSYSDTTIHNLETFNHASVRTKKQCSDLKELIPFQTTRLFDSSWYFNDFRDRLNRTGSRAESFGEFVRNLNNEVQILYPNNTAFNSRFIDTYVILRLIYGAANSDREIHLVSVDYKNQIVKK